MFQKAVHAVAYMTEYVVRSAFHTAYSYAVQYAGTDHICKYAEKYAGHTQKYAALLDEQVVCL